MSEVYANILETLTSGLYNDVKYAVREYLQNSYDAIKQASQNKLPIPDNGYFVDIAISKDNRIISITDNGIGMEEALLKEYTSIGGGTKNTPELAGHKGIGKLSGLRFFNEFKVRTKVLGLPKAYELHWKSGEMMNVLITQKEKMKKIPYKEFIGKFYSITEIGEEIDKHYTQIQLIDIVDEFKEQVSEDKIGEFVKQNCPVPYRDEEFQFASRLKNWIEGCFVFVNTHINGKIIYQFHTDEYNLVEPHLIEIKYSSLVHAKVWFSWIKNTAATIDDDKMRGLRFRCKGICVGDNNLFANNCMPPGRDQLANWFMGEIIVLDDDIRPSAARDKFYEGSRTRKLFTELRNQVGKELSSIADIRSAISAAEGALAEINALKKKGKSIPSMLMKRISDRAKELGRYKEKGKHGFEYGIIEKLKRVLERETEQETEKVNQEEEEIKTVKDPKVIVDKMMKLKEEQVNAFSKDVKKLKQAQIETLKEKLSHQISAGAGKDDQKSEDQSEKANLVLKIIIKYLEFKKIAYNKKEISSFIETNLA